MGGGYEGDLGGFFWFGVKIGFESLFFYKEKKNISQNHKDSP